VSTFKKKSVSTRFLYFSIVVPEVWMSMKRFTNKCKNVFQQVVKSCYFELSFLSTENCTIRVNRCRWIIFFCNLIFFFHFSSQKIYLELMDEEEEGSDRAEEKNVSKTWNWNSFVLRSIKSLKSWRHNTIFLIFL